MKNFLLTVALGLGAAYMVIPPKPEPIQTITAVGRFALVAPTHYAEHLPRVTKFFELIQEDSEVSSVKFEGTHQTGDNVLATIRAASEYAVTLNTYKPLWWRSAAIAYYENGIVKFNAYKLNRSDCKIINTITHETMHHYRYSHGPNDVKGKARDMSVPYWFGNKAEAYCLAGKI